MKRFSEYSLMVEENIRTLCPDLQRLPSLYKPIVYGMTAGGKRLRPVLTLMSCEAFGGNVRSAMSAAVGMEMFHNFTLLHDDVMDKSELRRGRLTVHKRWNENTAILSGDTMLTMATQMISEVPDDKLRKVLDVFNRTAIDVYEGQQLDVDFETRDDISLDEYLEMIRLKTSSLLGGATMIGSILGDASEDDCRAMYQYAVSMGLAFQIQDDYLDVYGDEQTFGKPIGGDINNGKKTWLMISALNQNGRYAEALRSALKMPVGQTKVKTITNLYSSIGVDKLAQDAIVHYSSEAVKALTNVSISKDEKQAFRTLVEKLIGRNK